MSTRGKAARGVLWGAVERAASQGISFLVVLVLARQLGPENYGLATLAATVVLFAQMLLGETFSEALVQAERLEPAHLSSIFWLLVGASLLAAAAVLAGADVLARYLGHAELAPLLHALSPLPLISAAQAVPVAMFRRALDFRSIAVASTVGALVGAVVGISLALAGFGVWAFIANLLTQNIGGACAIWFRTRFRPRLVFSRVHLASLWSYGQYTFVLRLAAYAANQGPRILVGYFFGAAVLGHFSVALRIVETIHQLIAVPAMNVLVPLAARYRLDRLRLHRGIIESTQLCAMVAVPAFVGLAVIAPAAMPLVFGRQWGGGAAIVQLLAAYGLIGSSAFLYRGIIAGLGRPDINLVTTLIVAVLGVALMALVAPWGPMATAAVFVARGYLVYPWLPWVVRRLCGIPTAMQLRGYGPVLCAAAIMALVMVAFQEAAAHALHPAVLVAVEVGLGTAVYTAMLYMVGRPAFRLGLTMLAVVRARPGAA